MLAMLATLVIGGQAITWHNPGGPRIVVEMEKGGTFVIATDPASSSRTVRRVLELVDDGFYNRQRFHRVEHWVSQWGAPGSADRPLTEDAVLGGGSGKNLVFEESPVEYARGTVGVASYGKKKGGDSQLFILKKDAFRLNTNYAVVGRVISGMDVVDRIEKGDRIRSMSVRR